MHEYIIMIRYDTCIYEYMCTIYMYIYIYSCIYLATDNAVERKESNTIKSNVSSRVRACWKHVFVYIQ